MERFGISPNRELGQHFLVDDNILGVIERVAELSSDDVVLEIGGGLGVLSAYLASRVRHLHVIESDAKLEPVLDDALARFDNVTTVIDDVMNVDLATLAPAPGKIVANLPYGVAVPAIIETIDQLPGAELWCVMVQREVADRMAAAPGSKTYGVPSVLCQLACEVKFERAISRSVFRPAPNVDSALVSMRRRGPAVAEPVKRIVHAAFGHRRKTLAGSLALAFDDRALRDRAREALVELGHPGDERAERLAPQEFVELAQRIEL
jgi:16S rRNA (adenine1518-N6/adenine1519-N6)-dimethyltransferase